MIQFSIRSLMVVTTILCLFLAMSLPQNQTLRLVATVIVATNVLGAIAAFFVTHVFGVPRDGGYRNQDSPEE
ncbi:hypothetical protein N9L06_07150 [Mariniblastus sp.]|nr:hypothetical protein [Mariniblastus sp.]